jgi:hypothetical protein
MKPSKGPVKIWLLPVGRDRVWYIAATAPTRAEALKAVAEIVSKRAFTGLFAVCERAPKTLNAAYVGVAAGEYLGRGRRSPR